MTAPRLTTLPLACLLLGAGFDTGPASAQVGAVIDRVLDAYGGPDAVAAVHSYRQEGMLVAVQGGAHGRVYRISAGPEKLSILIEYPSTSELRILESGRAWRGPSAAALTEVTGPLRGAMVLQAARAYLPQLLADHRERVVLEGSESGKAVLSLRVAEDLVLRMVVDDATGWIVRTESVLESAPARVGFATDYSHHRSVGGVVFAFREETFASGFRTGSTAFEAVELNPEGARAKLPLPGGP